MIKALSKFHSLFFRNSTINSSLYFFNRSFTATIDKCDISNFSPGCWENCTNCRCCCSNSFCPSNWRLFYILPMSNKLKNLIDVYKDIYMQVYEDVINHRWIDGNVLITAVPIDSSCTKGYARFTILMEYIIINLKKQ